MFISVWKREFFFCCLGVLDWDTLGVLYRCYFWCISVSIGKERERSGHWIENNSSSKREARLIRIRPYISPVNSIYD